MKEAHRLYYLAHARQTELNDLALQFYQECIRDFEEYAKEGNFCSTLYDDDIPDDLQEDFEELVVPLFKEEGFEVKFEEDYWRYSSASNERWTISWKKGE